MFSLNDALWLSFTENNYVIKPYEKVWKCNDKCLPLGPDSGPTPTPKPQPCSEKCGVIYSPCPGYKKPAA